MDQGRPEILDLFHEDAEVYFPSSESAADVGQLFEMIKGFEGAIEFIEHDYERLNIMPSGDYVVVEGTSKGKLSGKTWAGGKTPGGRFCNVFKFRGDRIASVHVYLEPDYAGEDAASVQMGQ